MKKVDAVRALRDAEYRESLTAEEKSRLPESAAPLADIDDEALKSVTGGCQPTTPGTSCVPPGYSCP